MSSNSTSSRQQKVMIPPIKLLFKFLQSHDRVQIWLFEQVDFRLEGSIRGFDEFMNLVIDDAVEINSKKDTRRSLGRILLKGDNITLISSLNSQS